jgi:signal transduction histidine kinase/ActR/RegA family two-component response regulator
VKVFELPELAADYSRALRDYLAGAQESALVHAYEIGRRAIEAGFGVLDLVTMHERAMAAELERATPEAVGRSASATMALFAECVAPFEMAQRGYRAATDAANEAREEAERANQAKSDFLSRVSHELRTPFNAVLGFAQVLEMDELTDDQRESVGQIIKAGRHLLDLINEVLDISRIESGTLSLSIEPVELRGLAGEALDLVRGIADRRGIALLADIGSAEGTFVMADRQRLKQVLLNLLSNAVKYNREEGSATLSIRRQGEPIRIEVADTGPGIPHDRIDRLFNPFERLGAEHGDVEGTGLGLAVSKRLVEAMGGAVGLAGTSETGTTFFVELRQTEPPSSTYQIGGQPAPTASSLGRSRTVLYVEDNLSNLTLVERILGHRPDVRIIPALNGQLGVELAKEHRPDLILLDLNLPDMPGEEVLRRLREDSDTRGIAVIVISADTARRQIEALRAAGAREFLGKPLDVPVFLATIDRILDSTG